MSSRIIIIISIALAGVTANAENKPGLPTIPFNFVENLGQASPSVRYLGLGPEFKAWFEDLGVVLQRGTTTIKIAFERNPQALEVTSRPDISSKTTIRPDDPTGARANFISGSDPNYWQTDLPLFGSIHYTGVWPGVDLAYKSEHGGLKAEYVVEPGASVGAILLRFDGEPDIRHDGTLRIHGFSGDFVEDKPWFYQSIHGERRVIDGGFRRLRTGAVGFWTADYDHTQPLVIDPSVLFSGYFGGSSQDNITGIGVDSLNNVFATGWTSSNDLPASSGARPKFAGTVDAFVASFLPNGGALRYCTYLGGSGDDRASGLVTDSTGNIYVTGWTSSTNFPVVGAVQTHLAGTRDAFVTKLNPGGNALIYSTYLGGSGVDAGYAIALSPTNSAVVVGDTTSTNFPVNNKAFQSKLNGAQDAFVAMLSPAGSALTVATYFGGSGVDHASSVKLGGVGNIIIGGYTWSNNFPVIKAYQPKSGGGQDGFVTKMYPDGSNIFWSTYLGGSGGSTGAPEGVNALCLDQNIIVVAGTTSSANFPVTAGSFQSSLAGQSEGFIARFGAPGALLQSTFLGGTLSDGINALAVDFHGNPSVTGFTSSQDFPVQRPTQNINAGSMDAFVVKLNTTLSSIIFGTYLGGSGSDSGNAIAVDGQSSIVVAGQTGSGDFPVSGSLQNSIPSTLSSFITKIAPSFTLGVAYAYQGQLEFSADPWHVSSYVSSTYYGNATDRPIVGDWDGSGTKRIGIFRNGTWYLDTNGNGVLDASDKIVSFGQAGDIPIVGDWRGTGRVAIGLFRQGTFILDLSGHLTGTPTGLSDATFVFGQGGDVPIIADWNGSGGAKV
jgi:hypothetical protein